MGRLLKIVQAGDPVLRAKARPLAQAEISSSEIQALIEQMRETMRDAPGVGLAAPQIGVSLQLVVIEDRPEYIERGDPEEARARERKPVPFQVLINPKLAITDATAVEFFEGCLSVADFAMVVPRARAVRVEALNERGNEVTLDAEGWPARILQHEIDHLRGVLCIDRMRSRTFAAARNHVRYWQGQPIADVMKAVGETEDVAAPLSNGG